MTTYKNFHHYLFLASLGVLFLIILALLLRSKAVPTGQSTPVVTKGSEKSVMTNVPEKVSGSAFPPPLSKSRDRVTKKPFGLYVSPQNSPVAPEKFHGYHTGVDFEVFDSEREETISVIAVCSGKLLQKGFVTGYGGIAIQLCDLNGESITILYGHLRPNSIVKNPEDQFSLGDPVGFLGNGFSQETDEERKHLHLGFHKGTVVNFRGYVASKDELLNWIDPCQYVCQ